MARVDDFVTLMSKEPPRMPRVLQPQRTPRTPRCVTSSQRSRANAILSDDPASAVSASRFGAAPTSRGIDLVSELAETARTQLTLQELVELRRKLNQTIEGREAAREDRQT